MPGVCLLIQFNHAFVENIPKLDRIYRDRFSQIVYLVPFVRSSDPRIVTTYWGSFTFQGYISQALEKLASIDCDGFLFHQDDVILNPALDEINVSEHIPLGQQESFIPELTALSARDTCFGPDGFWNWSSRVLFNFLAPRETTIGSGVENMLAHLPPAEFARKRMMEQGIDTSPVTIDTAALEQTGFRVDAALWKIFVHVPGPAFTISLPYPVARAVSDLFLFPKTILPAFAHYCGVLAAGNIFVEVAIPTALVLASKHVRTCRDLKRCVDWRWGKDADRFKEFQRIDEVFAYFRQDLLAIHPVKLSKIEVP
jgi:hypothetical protein